jgi:cation transport ATPase
MNEEKSRDDVKPRFWASLLFTFPFYLRALDPWLQWLFATIVLLIGVWPFIATVKEKNQSKLLVLAIAVLYIYSFFELLFEARPHLFYKQIATLTFVSLFWIELEAVLEESLMTPLSNFFNLLPKNVTKLFPDSHQEEVPLETISKNDCILVPPGTIIPVDGVILRGTALVDESAIFGAVKPVTKGFASLVITGSKNLQELCTIQVKHSPAGTLYAKTAEKLSQYVKDGAQASVNNGFMVLPIVMAIIGFLFWSLFSSLAEGVDVFASIVIIASPALFELGDHLARTQALAQNLEHGCEFGARDTFDEGFQDACSKIKKQNHFLATLYLCIALPLALFGVISVVPALFCFIFASILIYFNVLRLS